MAGEKTPHSLEDPNSMASRGYNLPEFAEFHKDTKRSEQDQEWFGLISGAIHSFGQIRQWSAGARYNLVASVLGSLSYREPELPSLSAEAIAGSTGFRLAMTFTGFARDAGEVSPDLHEERERLSAELGEGNVLPSFYSDEHGDIQLGLFIRRAE